MAGQVYEAFVPVLISKTKYRPSNATLALAEEVTRSVAVFDDRYGQHVQPFSTLLLRSESVASSQIENLTASARSLGEAELGIGEKLNATLVVRNVRAMEAALQASENLSPSAVLEMHRVLMEGTRDSAVVGMWRTQQVWIGTSNVTPVGAVFVPPSHTRIPELMDDVMEYAARSDVPAIVQAAIAHAQFETIHPFIDGNGRTGRSLLHAMLRRRRVASHVTVPVSAGLLTNVNAYHLALTAYRDGDPEPIINLTSEASLLAIENGTHLATDVMGIRESWRTKVKARADSAVWPVLDLLSRQPVVNQDSLTKLNLDYMRSKRAMDTLAEAGVVIGIDKYKKGRFWRAPEILRALDDFAARAGSRQRS